MPAVRVWLGLDGGEAAGLKHATNEALALYNVEQVWYDPRSLGPNSNTFLEADVAIATLDTPAFDIPTWTMLFSPLTEETHAIITGYGNRGIGTTGPVGIDWRRRSAENMLSVLGSLNDKNDALFGFNPARPNPQSLYQLDFDSPAGEEAFDPANNRNDFDHFDGKALPREGTTGGGDSGGPLIVDQKFDKPVVVGVLSGGSRVSLRVGTNPDGTPIFRAPPFSTYGTTSFYQPLFLFWDQIVANNSYVYAGAQEGDGNWEDAGHWVQLMDPNYAVERNGKLVNDLPDTPALGVSGNTVKFGQICFLASCDDISEDAEATPVPVGSGQGLVIAGGPGSTNFVPNNVVANPKAGVKARYYDVLLSERGTTTLSSSVVIDKLTIDGPSKLDVKSSGSLRSLGDFEQWQGWTSVDGLLRANEALIATGLLSGTGTLQAPFVTVGRAVVAPGGADTVGTFRIDGNLIMSSASALFVDAGRAGADKLAVTGIASLSDGTNPGASLVFNKAKGAAPRHGQSFTIVEAGQVQGTFGQVFSFQGVLRPELTYTDKQVIANLRAGSLAVQLGQSGPTERAFAVALDQLRGNFYDNLFGLYGAIDLMDGASLSRTLTGLAPTAIAAETLSFQEKQSKVMLSAVSDRLSSLGARGTGGTLSVVGSPQALGALMGNPTGLTSNAISGLGGGTRSFVGGERVAGALPETMFGFITGGVSTAGSSFGDNRVEVAGQRSWNVGMGLEMEVAEGTTFGTAFAVAEGLALPGGENARVESRASQAAVYGTHQLGGGAYVAGLAAAERSRTGIERQAFTGEAVSALTGATDTARYSAMVESGVNIGVAKGLTLTPRASLGYSSYRLSGFRETGGEAALALDDLELNRLDARIGAKFAGSTPVGRSGWSFVPQIQADWVQNLSGARSGMTVRFANAADVAIALPLFDGDRSWTEVKGGMRLTNGAIEVGAGLEGSFGRQSFRDERAVADLTIRF